MFEVNDTESGAGGAASGARREGGSAGSVGGGSGGDARQGALHAVLHAGQLTLQTDFQPGERLHFQLSELMDYHDRHFVECVYRAVLRREPSQAERTRELEELRGGRASKVEIIERVLSSAEARASGRDVRVEGLPSPLMRRVSRLPVLGYALRLVRALVRLPSQLQHQQRFEIYVLAQQQRIVDYVNGRQAGGLVLGGESSPQGDVGDALAMFSDALLELSNNHADWQTQMEQAQAALRDLTEAITVQQQVSETLRREQQLAADAQQEFLIQEQRVIVETQKVVVEELRAELAALSERQERARAQFEEEMRRLSALRETAAAEENFSDQA